MIMEGKSRLRSFPLEEWLLGFFYGHGACVQDFYVYEFFNVASKLRIGYHGSESLNYYICKICALILNGVSINPLLASYVVYLRQASGNPNYRLENVYVPTKVRS